METREQIHGARGAAELKKSCVLVGGEKTGGKGGYVHACMHARLGMYSTMMMMDECDGLDEGWLHCWAIIESGQLVARRLLSAVMRFSLSTRFRPRRLVVLRYEWMWSVGPLSLGR